MGCWGARAMGYRGSRLLECQDDGVLRCWALMCQALEVLGCSAIVLRCWGARVVGYESVGVSGCWGTVLLS